jgi:hypothetical protein
MENRFESENFAESSRLPRSGFHQQGKLVRISSETMSGHEIKSTCGQLALPTLMDGMSGVSSA